MIKWKKKKKELRKKMKVLVLSCGTGGGHNAAALAINEELNKRNIESNFKEYLDIINPKIRKCVNTLYIKSTRGKGAIFKNVYRLGEAYSKTKWKSPVYTLNSFNKLKLLRYIQENQYDYIVTTHLFAAEVLSTIKKEYPIHFIAVATDYVCIPFWEETNPDYFIIPSKELEYNFIEKGIKKEKLIPLGIPVSTRYLEAYDREQLLNALKLDNHKKYILILTGSMGFGNVNKIVEELLNKIEPEYTVIVGCGNNQKLKETIDAKFQNSQQVIALPFTKEIDKYMKIAEMILTKPGGLTTTEIATIRKPLIHTMPIPGCENYNAEYFSKRGMSLKSNDMQEVIENVCRLLKEEELQKKMIKHQQEYIQKESCSKICEFIIEQIKGKE